MLFFGAAAHGETVRLAVLLQCEDLAVAATCLVKRMVDKVDPDIYQRDWALH
jgi:hypothetical protein